MINYELLDVTMTRIELCDLILACGLISMQNRDAHKWELLRKKLRVQLDNFDESYEMGA